MEAEGAAAYPAGTALQGAGALGAHDADPAPVEGLGAAALIQEFLDALAATDPESVARVLIEDPEGMDNTLLQFQAFSVIVSEPRE